MISDQHELNLFLVTPGIEVTSVIYLSDEVFWVSWHYNDEEIASNLRHMNVISGYVTAGFRLRLYAYLDSFQESALYWDTVSVFYIQKDNEPDFIQ
jgi:hypothetical protein